MTTPPPGQVARMATTLRRLIVEARNDIPDRWRAFGDLLADTGALSDMVLEAELAHGQEGDDREALRMAVLREVDATWQRPEDRPADPHAQALAAVDDLGMALTELRYDQTTVADIAADWLDKTRGVIEAHRRIVRPR